MSLEREVLPLVGCLKQLLFGAVVVKFGDNVTGWAVWLAWSESSVDLSILRCSIRMDQARSWNRAVIMDWRSTTVSGNPQILMLDRRALFS